MKSVRIALTIVLVLFFKLAFTQVTSVPQTAKDNFANQYPAAQEVKWSNDIVNVNVHFILDGKQMNAEYNNKGIWKNTLENISTDSLPPAVQDGLSKSKYADREITDSKIIHYPGGVTQYRVRVEKNDLEKKFLYFDGNGKLVRDAITL